MGSPMQINRDFGIVGEENKRYMKPVACSTLDRGQNTLK